MVFLKFVRALGLVVVVSTLSACAGRPEHIDVAPVYRLSVTPTAVSWLRTGQTLAVTLEDKRAEAPVIGQNIEESVAVPVRESPRGASAQVVQTALTKELRDLGATFVAPSAADRTLRVTLIKLWVEEGGTYSGEIRARVSVVDKEGASRAEVLAVGTSRRFGRSLSVENYQETIESMIQNMIENLFADEGFQKGFADTPNP